MVRIIRPCLVTMQRLIVIKRRRKPIKVGGIEKRIIDFHLKGMTTINEIYMFCLCETKEGGKSPRVKEGERNEITTFAEYYIVNCRDI